jgi:hypothetical protein
MGTTGTLFADLSRRSNGRIHTGRLSGPRGLRMVLTLATADVCAVGLAVGRAGERTHPLAAVSFPGPARRLGGILAFERHRRIARLVRGPACSADDGRVWHPRCNTKARRYR